MSTTNSPEAASSTAVRDEDDDVASSARAAAEAAPSSPSGGAGGALPAAVEFEPPLACVRRILKHALPSATNVGKDASAAFARASGIFIIYLTSCANDFAREGKRQTITANDVLAAIKEVEFDEFLPDMLKFLDNYRASEKSKKDAKAKAAASKAGKQQDNNEDEEEEEDESHDGNEEMDESMKRERGESMDTEALEPDAKKPKTDVADEGNAPTNDATQDESGEADASNADAE